MGAVSAFDPVIPKAKTKPTLQEVREKILLWPHRLLSWAGLFLCPNEYYLVILACFEIRFSKSTDAITLVFNI